VAKTSGASLRRRASFSNLGFVLNNGIIIHIANTVSMAKSAKKILILLITPLVFLFGTARLAADLSRAQSTDDLEKQAADLAAQQSELQQRLNAIENQIADYQQGLKSIQGQKNTLQNKISRLDSQKSILELRAEATDLQLNDLYAEAAMTGAYIDDSTDKAQRAEKQIGELLNIISRNDNERSFFDSLLSRDNLSDVITEFKYDGLILGGLSDSLAGLKQLKQNLSKRADDLARERSDIQNLRAIQQLQLESLADATAEQAVLLASANNEEGAYRAGLENARETAAKIRSRIYNLMDALEQINFGQAVQIAEWAGGQTGVRAAFLLAILTQESNLGKNVGTCNRAGDPPSKSYKAVMNPTRDQPIFLGLMKQLGRDPDNTPISCPMHDKNGNQIGWGGAMGPAQFIPSTWAGYSDKVTAITGHPADPWDIRDAFLAAAIKLGHDGAASQDGEWAAAMRYFSGGTDARFSFYGDQVVARADKYQQDIDKLDN